jgi:hypothetical protein
MQSLVALERQPRVHLRVDPVLAAAVADALATIDEIDRLLNMILGPEGPTPSSSPPLEIPMSPAGSPRSGG